MKCFRSHSICQKNGSCSEPHAPSLELGNSWIWGHFIMNAGGGIGYNITVMGDDIYEDDELHGVAMLINFSIGFVL